MTTARALLRDTPARQETSNWSLSFAHSRTPLDVAPLRRDQAFLRPGDIVELDHDRRAGQLQDGLAAGHPEWMVRGGDEDDIESLGPFLHELDGALVRPDADVHGAY
jgi:hypothetical protein